MDKLTFSNDIETRLRQLASHLDQIINRPRASPSTIDASRQVADSQSRAQAAKTRIAEALTAVTALRNSEEPDWEQPRQDLEQRWQELSREFPF